MVPGRCRQGSARASRLIRLCESLAIIQRNTVAPILIPDLSSVMTAEAREWARVSRLLEGEGQEVTWEHAETSLPAEADMTTFMHDAFTVATRIPLQVDIAGKVIDLGF